jgi:hypothetical protein
MKEFINQSVTKFGETGYVFRIARPISGEPILTVNGLVQELGHNYLFDYGTRIVFIGSKPEPSDRIRVYGLAESAPSASVLSSTDSLRSQYGTTASELSQFSDSEARP